MSAASPGTVASAEAEAQALLGRPVGTVPRPRDAHELAAAHDDSLAKLEHVAAIAPEFRAADLWTQADAEAAEVLGGNVAALRRLAELRGAPGAPDLSAHDVAVGLVVSAEATTLVRALDARGAAFADCARSGGTPEQCAATALGLNPTPRTPALPTGRGFAIGLALAATVAVALGALALYAGKRRQFLDGFYSPRPRRIAARAGAGARRGGSDYQLEVE